MTDEQKKELLEMVEAVFSDMNSRDKAFTGSLMLNYKDGRLMDVKAEKRFKNKNIDIYN